MRTGHLFAGSGGGLYADLILGHTPVFAVEWDDYAVAALRERANEGWFPGLHLYHGDVRMFDTSPWQGRVDSIHAGFPCQDISVAGTGAGIEGERSGLWGEVKRITGELRPQELFLENSPAITSRGLGIVLGDLAELGYDAQWCVLPASGVGAPHIRARWWCLARRADSDGMWELQPERELRNKWGWLGNMGKDVPDSMRQRHSGQTAAEESAHNQERNSETHREERGEKPGSTFTGREDVANTASKGLQEREVFCCREKQKRQPDQRKATKRDHWWDTEPGVGRVVNGLANRGNRIKALGNGQVPLQAAAAYVLLSGRLGT